MSPSPAGRILGVDAGERRIGLAISDPGGSFALPLNSIPADGTEFEALRHQVEAEGVVEVVVGLPLSLSGEASAQTERARAFASRLEEHAGVPVTMWDERLSSQEAERLTSGPPDRRSREQSRRRGHRRQSEVDTDALAASIILQAYLDSRRTGPGEQH